MRILLVEDDQKIAKAMRRVLESKALVTHCSSLGEVRVADVSQVSAVVVDLGLPDSQGLSTLDAVRALLPNDVAIVVFTGRAELGEQAMERGAHDYLVKADSTPLDLPDALLEALGRKKLASAMANVTKPTKGGRKSTNMALSREVPKTMIALGQHLQLLATES